MPYKDKEKGKEYQKEYRRKYRERRIQYFKEYYKKNKKELKEYCKKNGNKISERRKEYYQKNKEHLRKSSREWYKKNKKRRSLYSRKYNQRPKVIVKRRERARRDNKERQKTDQNYNICCKLRIRLWKVFKRYIKTRKIISSKKYGIDWQAIIEYLKPFPEDISKYHIDHIRPLCSFNLTNPEEIKIAFAPKNHQWLLASENMVKGGRYRKV